jgi:HAD superfamily hydrolase (TIGR01509 family)
MTPFELVIFDCDGVLVDSERITHRLFQRMLEEIGLALSHDDMYERFVGRSMPQCLDIITHLKGAAPPDGFVDDYRARIKVAFEAELRAVAGIEDVLNGLELPYCVASSGDHYKMRLTLGLTKLLPRFTGRMFSVTEVAQSKPAPDVFLHAARKCNAHPAACLVVEDTPTGVTAGVAAGMTVYGYAAMTPVERLRDAGAHQVFSNMQDLPRLIAAGRAIEGRQARPGTGTCPPP